MSGRLPLPALPLAGSRLGLVLALLYLAGAGFFVQDELRHSGGGWINLRGLGTVIATAPSQATLGTLLRKAGVPKVNFAAPGVAGYLELALHLLVTAGVVYLLGWGLEWTARRLMA